MNPFFFLPFPAWPFCLRPLQAPPFSTPTPPGLYRRIRRGQSEKMPRRDCQLLFADPLGSIVWSTVPAVDQSTMTPANFLASSPPRRLFARRPSMQRPCYLPLTLVDQSILPPYSSTVVDKRSVNQATGCLTSAPSLCQSPQWLVWWGEGLAPGASCMHSDKANGEKGACSSRPRLRMAPQFVEAGSKQPLT